MVDLPEPDRPMMMMKISPGGFPASHRARRRTGRRRAFRRASLPGSRARKVSALALYTFRDCGRPERAAHRRRAGPCRSGVPTPAGLNLGRGAPGRAKPWPWGPHLSVVTAGSIAAALGRRASAIRPAGGRAGGCDRPGSVFGLVLGHIGGDTPRRAACTSTSTSLTMRFSSGRRPSASQHGIGAGPLLLGLGGGVFEDVAMRLAAVEGLVGIDAHFGSV